VEEDAPEMSVHKPDQKNLPFVTFVIFSLSFQSAELLDRKQRVQVEYYLLSTCCFILETSWQTSLLIRNYSINLISVHIMHCNKLYMNFHFDTASCPQDLS
jgi:hypothetical protein